MRIIVEGPDAEGKTVVAQEIARKLLLDYEHRGAPANKAEILADLKRDFVVFDRAWLGEMVYPYIYGREALITSQEINSYKTLGIRTLYVVLTSPVPTNFHDVEDELYERHAEIHSLFIKALGQVWNGEKVVFNPLHFSNKEELIKTVSEFAVRWAQKATPVYPATVSDYRYTLFDPFYMNLSGTNRHKTSCYCGHFRDHKEYDYWKTYGRITEGTGNDIDPKVVFVGEAPGRFGCGRYGIPFYGDRSGMYFREALFWRGYAETDVWITNAVKCTPADNHLNVEYGQKCFNDNTLFELEVIWQGRLVAVGGKAADYLRSRFGSVAKVMHPAYFLYKRAPVAAYVNEFKNSV